MSRLPCPVPYKLPSCERFSLGQLLCFSYNWSYKVRFFKSCVLKAEFYFWPDTFCPPLSLSAIFKGADADKVDEVQFDVFCFNLLAHSSVERVWGWHSLHCSLCISPPHPRLITALCLGGLWSWDDGAGLGPSVTGMARLLVRGDGDIPAEMNVLQGWALAFTAFHHKLNVYTALLSRLRPLQIWASGWGYFAFKSHTDSNPSQRYLSPRLCRDFSPPLLGLNYFNTDLLSEDTVILDLLPDLITCVRSSLFPINHFE